MMCERSTSRVIAHSRTWFALSLMGGGRSSSSSSRDPAESPTPPPPAARMHDALRRLLRGAAALPRTCKSGDRAATAANMFVCFLKAPTPVRGRRFVGGLSSKSILYFLRFVWSLLFWGFFGGAGIFHPSHLPQLFDDRPTTSVDEQRFLSDGAPRRQKIMRDVIHQQKCLCEYDDVTVLFFCSFALLVPVSLRRFLVPVSLLRRFPLPRGHHPLERLLPVLQLQLRVDDVQRLVHSQNLWDVEGDKGWGGGDACQTFRSQKTVTMKCVTRSVSDTRTRTRNGK